ncbi:vegetative cell wall protein gp1-like [Iris pallida]|uniref:Vegetative cell wall protein gp1-like n=1 Tax=Iris pallida TaxID=29817 RepID=A0AAX6FBK5_IRIPA|nr:vegetative cell wall protein gp1-like [Iris pallida]
MVRRETRLLSLAIEEASGSGVARSGMARPRQLSENTCTLVRAAQGRSRRALTSGQREACLVSAVRIYAQRRGSGTRQRCLASGGAVGDRRWGTVRVGGGDHWPRSRRWRWLSVAATRWCTKRMRLPLAVWS